MEKKLLFTLNVLQISGKKRICETTSLKEALKLMRELKCCFITLVAQINVYNDGLEKLSLPQDQKLVICFGDLLNYQEALKIAKRNKMIELPKEFLYDRNYYEETFLYSARNKTICVTQDITSLYISEDYVDATLSRMENNGIFSRSSADVLKDNFCLFEDKGFILGGGNMHFHYDVKDFKSALAEFKKNSDKFSFIQVFSIKYLGDGSIHYIKDDLFIFRNEWQISAAEAFRLSKGKLSKRISSGTHKFIYDKCYDKVIVAPSNSVFVPSGTIFHKWNF